MEKRYIIHVWVESPDGEQKCFCLPVTRSDAVKVTDTIGEILTAVDAKNYFQVILCEPFI